MLKWGFLWSRQESNLHPRLRKPIYYPLYYETVTKVQKYNIACRLLSYGGDNQKNSLLGHSRVFCYLRCLNQPNSRLFCK